MREKPTEQTTVNWDLLDRHYAGETTPEEGKRVERYLAEHPGMADVLPALVRSVRHAAQHRIAPADVRTMLAAAHQRMARTSTFRALVERQIDHQVGHPLAALLDVDAAELTPQELEDLLRMIDDARAEGR